MLSEQFERRIEIRKEVLGEKFALHFRGTLRNGCTLEELREILPRVAVYCGMPAAVESFRIACRILAGSESTAA